MILISACLLGCACRYDGQSKAHPLAQELARRRLAVPVCPEQLGGLSTPRAPSEQREGRVVSAATPPVVNPVIVPFRIFFCRAASSTA